MDIKSDLNVTDIKTLQDIETKIKEAGKDNKLTITITMSGEKELYENTIKDEDLTRPSIFVLKDLIKRRKGLIEKLLAES